MKNKLCLSPKAPFAINPIDHRHRLHSAAQSSLATFFSCDPLEGGHALPSGESSSMSLLLLLLLLLFVSRNLNEGDRVDYHRLRDRHKVSSFLEMKTDIYAIHAKKKKHVVYLFRSLTTPVQVKYLHVYERTALGWLVVTPL